MAHFLLINYPTGGNNYISKEQRVSIDNSAEKTIEEVIEKSIDEEQPNFLPILSKETESYLINKAINHWLSQIPKW